MEEGELWSKKYLRGILQVHLSLWNTCRINANTHLSLRTMSIPTYELFSRQNEGNNYQDNVKWHRSRGVGA